MKQNKFVQIIIYLATICLQIVGFMYLVSHSEQPFDTTVLPTLLFKYGTTIAGVLVLAGLIYGGHFVKKHRASWIHYAEINVFFPLMKGFAINIGFYMTNIAIMVIMDIFGYSKDINKEMMYIGGKILIMLAINLSALLATFLIYMASLPSNTTTNPETLY